MKKNRPLFKVWSLLFLMGFILNTSFLTAQTDVTSTYLTNAGFDVSCNFLFDDAASDLGTVGDASGLLAVTGWTAVFDGGYDAAATFEYGYAGTLNGAPIPATGSDGTTTGSGQGSLGINVSWSGSASYNQSVTLPAGTYVLSYKGYNSGTATAGASMAGWVPDAGTATLSSVTEFPLNTWTSDAVTFVVSEETSGKIQMGLQAGNAGSGSHGKVFFDDLVLTYDPVILSDDADLGSISLDVGTLYPDFDPAITNYIVVASTGTSSINVTPATSDANATFTGGGAIDVSTGEAMDIITVTAEIGNTKSYKIFYTVGDCFTPYYTDAENLVPDPLMTDRTLYGGWGTVTFVSDPAPYCGNLSAYLYADDGGCKAALDMSGFTFEKSTAYRVRAMVKTVDGSLGFLANGSDPNFLVTIPQSGDNWVQFDTVFVTGANAGTNFISFNTCDGGSNGFNMYVDNYEVYIVPESEASLRDLTFVDGSVITPGFNYNETTYDVVLPAGTTAVTPTALPMHLGATVSGADEVDVSSGTGSSTITVTSADGNTTKDYTVNYTIAVLSNDATLSSLSLDVGHIGPAMDVSSNDYYVAVVPVGTTSVTVSAEANDPNASVTAGTGAVDVSSGAADVTVTVTAEDGTTTADYIIHLVVSENLIELTDANGATGADSEQNKWGWINDAVDSWGEANGGGVRYMDVTDHTDADGNTYSGRVILQRWDYGGEYPGSVYAYPVYLEGGCKSYTLSSLVEWWNNGSQPTYRFAISDAPEGGNIIAYKDFLASETKNRLMPFDMSFNVETEGLYYIQVSEAAGGNGIIGLAEMAVLANSDEILVVSTDNLEFYDYDAVRTFTVSGNALTNDVTLTAPTGITLDVTSITAAEAQCGVTVTATFDGSANLGDSIYVQAGTLADTITVIAHGPISIETGKAYWIISEAGGTAIGEGASQGVQVQTKASVDAQRIIITESHVPGQYFIKNNLTGYLGLSSSNTWNMLWVADTTTSSDSVRYTLTEFEDGKFFIHNNVKSSTQFLGLDAVTDGSSIYCDKPSSDANSVWIFEEYVEPVQPASITFIVDDSKRASATGFAIKGSWNTATGEYDAAWNNGDEHSDFYDDGTNGDATAGDHIWTVTLELIPDGGTNTWEWGVNDADGNWLDGNFQFTVTDATAQTLDAYVIPGNDATLSALSLDPAGTLNPTFVSSTTEYTADVPAGTTSVTVSATATDADATISGDGAIDVSSGSATASISVTAEDGTTTETYTIEISVLDGIEGSLLNQIEVYPNPVHQTLNIDNVQNARISIYNVNGALIRDMNNVNDELKLDVEDLSSGVYLLKIQMNEGVKVTRFVKD